MSLTVCLPVAGTGSRLGELTRHLNKSLMSVGCKPTLARIIDSFPADTEFVLPLGYKGELVREFLSLAYPGRTFHFAEVDPYEGPGSGLGLSLLACRHFLQKPFIFISCDTLVTEAIPLPDRNWMGWARREDSNAYRTLAIEGRRVVAIQEKGMALAPESQPYIGLAGIADPDLFWRGMEDGGAAAVEQGEAAGLRALLDKGKHIEACPFTWYDTGLPAGLAEADAAFRQPDAPNILNKPDEAIWFVGDRVIKYADSKEFIAQRTARAQVLEGFVPPVEAATPHMYAYRRAEGEVLAKVITLPLFARLLDHCRTFWQQAELTPAESEHFRRSCMDFYKTKTLARVEKFYAVFQKADGELTINGVPTPPLSVLLDRVDWEELSHGCIGRFHGDFHFENILWNEAQQRFTFLDWRQNFAGDLKRGDIYYDLAKLLHGLIVSHGVIAHDQYTATWEGSELRFDLMRPHSLVLCQRHFERWLAEHGYDVRKVRLLTALIYLNIAALHHYPYCLLLYGLGTSMLHELQEEKTHD